ncbi:flagellar hook-associated family protein [soil metagenome]
MRTSWVSTQSLSQATRRTILDLQTQLLRAEKESASGRLADAGLSLGYRTADTISFRNDHARLDAIITTNGLVSARLDATQSALDGIGEQAQDFLDSLAVGQSGTGDRTIIQNKAKLAISSMTSALNTSVSGEFLFAGINTDVSPVGDYYDAASPARQAVADAFTAHFGFSQSSPNVATISATDMEDFLDTTFADLFSDANWSGTWSSASSQNVRSRISTNELVTTSTNANDVAFRKLAQAFTMVADLGLENMSDAAASAVMTRAMTVTGEAIGKLTSVRATLGNAQEQVTRSSERMSLQKDILNTQINALESVDPYEAATRVNTLMSQIETSYALTGRLNDLTLLKYI